MSELLLARSAGAVVDGTCVVPNDLHMQFDLLAASGGGQAMWPNGFSGRAAPGSMLRPAPHEIWFSCTDAAAPSLHAHAAGLATLARLTERDDTHILTLSPWFDTLRGRIASTFGPAGTSVILAPSIAAARDLARAIAYSIHGVPAGEISAGAAESADDMGDTVDVPLRLADGKSREAREINHEALQAARNMASPLLVHVLDQARSGLTGLTRAGADAISRERETLTLIDASEMRTTPDCLNWDLQAGRLVLISGSTFLGGHANSAALLVPASLAMRLTHAAPSHLIAEAAAHDMAPEWRDLFCTEGAPRHNIGLGLRWSAALAELDRYLQTPAPLREAILDLFNRRILVRLSRYEWVERVEEGRGGVAPLLLCGASLEDAQALREGLATSTDAPGDAACHLGAPIALGDGSAALPVSLSAPMVSDVAGRIAKGVSFERAFAPVQRDIDTLFQKIDRLWN